MDNRLHFNYFWHQLDNRGIQFAVREFLDNGANRFVLTAPLLQQLLDDQERKDFLQQLCRDMKVQFSTTHAFYGIEHDLNINNPVRRPQMLAEHIWAMETAAEFNCKTFTIHVGAGDYCYKKCPLEILRPLAVEALEKLLPTAEKLGMVIAVENSFEMPNSAKEVFGLIRHFDGHPALGVCYDTGHAHCMAPTPGKDKNLYEPYFAASWWEDGVIYEDNALETLKEHVVTCHIHDNNGYGDYHGMPFDGTIDWQKLMPELFSCPHMIDMQTEVCFCDGENWSGKLLAPVGGYSIRRLTDTFRYLGF